MKNNYGFSVEYQYENKNLIIRAKKTDFEFDQMFDELGDFDIVQANEIEQNHIAFEGLVYEMDDQAIGILKNKKIVELSCLGTVRDMADKEFVEWYF